MRAISAADSVSPAIQRTRDFLFRPFSWGTYLKLGLVAVLTEGFSSNLKSSKSNAGGQPSGHGPVITSPHDLLQAIKPEWIVAAVAVVVLAIIVSLVIAWLITRLRFAYFHCLVHNTREIGPGWHLYRDRAARFFWMNVVVGLCFLVVVVLIALPFISGFMRLFHDMPPGGHPDWMGLASLVLPLIPIFLLLVLAAYLSDVILRDFMLPHYALEDATVGEAWSEVWARITAEKAQFIAYALLRLVLPAIAMIALFIVLIIPGIFLVGSLGGIEYGIHAAFADATGLTKAIEIALMAFFGLVGLGLGLLASICLAGPIATASREYALIFYGGRYRLMGDILYPPPPPAQELGAPQTA
jgi:hypothetical protein